MFRLFDAERQRLFDNIAAEFDHLTRRSAPQ
jgi:hypothetical protein